MMTLRVETRQHVSFRNNVPLVPTLVVTPVGATVSRSLARARITTKFLRKAGTLAIVVLKAF
jgi:hypothetical protein